MTRTISVLWAPGLTLGALRLELPEDSLMLPPGDSTYGRTTS